jgi:DNA-binding MarR family transcriptional regulator
MTAGPKQSKLSKADYQMLAEFRGHLRQFLRFSENAARLAGISPQQHQALLAVKGFSGRHGIHIGELAERLQIRHHSAVGMVDRLAKHGYVRRRTDPRDRRRVEVMLARKGDLVLESLAASHRQQLRQVAPRLDRLLKQIVTWNPS